MAGGGRAGVCRRPVRPRRAAVAGAARLLPGLVLRRPDGDGVRQGHAGAHEQGRERLDGLRHADRPQPAALRRLLDPHGCAGHGLRHRRRRHVSDRDADPPERRRGCPGRGLRDGLQQRQPLCRGRRSADHRGRRRPL